MRTTSWAWVLSILIPVVGGEPAAANDVDDAIFHRGSSDYGIAYRGHWSTYKVKVEGSRWTDATPAYEVWLKNYSNTTARRVTFPSPELALKWAATHRKSTVTLIEVRGRQVLWVQGLSNRTIRNPTSVEAILADSWEETAKHFKNAPGPLLYRGVYGSTGSLFTFQRQYGVRFTLPTGASPALKAWADDVLEDALRAGATVVKRSDGHYHYTTHGDFDTSAIALPPTPRSSLAGALGATVVTVVKREPPKPDPAQRPEGTGDEDPDDAGLE